MLIVNIIYSEMINLIMTVFVCTENTTEIPCQQMNICWHFHPVKKLMIEQIKQWTQKRIWKYECAEKKIVIFQQSESGWNENKEFCNMKKKNVCITLKWAPHSFSVICQLNFMFPSSFLPRFSGKKFATKKSYKNKYEMDKMQIST